MSSDQLKAVTQVAFERLDNVSRALEQGEEPNWGELPLLQAVDMVRAGQAQVQDAIELNEEQDNDLQQYE